MIVVIRAGASESEVAAVVARAHELGLTYHLSRGAERAIVIVSDADAAAVEAEFRALPAVEAVMPLTRPYRLSSREVHPTNTLVEAGGLIIGTERPAIIAGPAAPTAPPDLIALATDLRAAGADALRVGVYRPQTALYGTPQLDPDALQRIEAARRASGLPIAATVLDAADVPAIARYVDLLIVSGAHMSNRPLLQACGWSNRPVVLERGESARLADWLQAADHILACGNRQLVLCEAGIRTYEPATPATLDLAAVPLVRRVSHLPIVVAPARGATERGTLEALACAAIAAGAHGLLLDVRDASTPDSAGTLAIDELARLVEKLHPLAAALA